MTVSVLLKNVRKTFATPGLGIANQQVLVGVDLQLSPGSSTAITGASGCGKSTLLNIIAGLETIQSGEIYVDGFALHGMKSFELEAYRLQTLSIVFQFFHLLPTLTAIENICLPAFEKFPTRKKEIKNAAQNLLERMGLGAFAKYFPSQMSGGMQSRTALARSILCEPKLILADEPTGSLDSKNGTEVLKIISEYQLNSGCTLIMVTHDEKAAQLATHQIHMQDGIIANPTKELNSSK